MDCHFLFLFDLIFWLCIRPMQLILFKTIDTTFFFFLAFPAPRERHGWQIRSDASSTNMCAELLDHCLILMRKANEDSLDLRP
jgi:hypothetical protein